ncbi:hypothetical protein BC834DRAFT_173275 [Gloeopeniophorella convolvens]|nr:hypothetical protein BC834DRAFT_173275 [Gloeopeniophorella convolvens]
MYFDLFAPPSSPSGEEAPVSILGGSPWRCRARLPPRLFVTRWMALGTQALRNLLGHTCPGGGQRRRNSSSSTCSPSPGSQSQIQGLRTKTAGWQMRWERKPTADVWKMTSLRRGAEGRSLRMSRRGHTCFVTRTGLQNNLSVVSCSCPCWGRMKTTSCS